MDKNHRYYIIIISLLLVHLVILSYLLIMKNQNQERSNEALQNIHKRYDLVWGYQGSSVDQTKQQGIFMKIDKVTGEVWAVDGISATSLKLFPLKLDLDGNVFTSQ